MANRAERYMERQREAAQNGRVDVTNKTGISDTQDRSAA
jgi:hypothetical protein